MGMISVPKIREAQIGQEGTRVIVIVDGKAVIDLPWDAALQLANGIRVKAKQAEELVKANQIIEDQAVLTRLGIPFGLSNNPDIQKEACKEAAHSSFLRKAIPVSRAGGIRSQAVFGTPTLIKHKPKENQNG